MPSTQLIIKGVSLQVVRYMNDKRLWIIFLIIFVNLLGFGIILPLMPYYVESFGAGPITIGLLASSYSLFQFFAAPILGEISDKIGRRPVLLFSIGGTAISFLLMGAATSIPMLFVARIIDGISGGNISTAQAYIADITTKEKRTQGMGMMMAAFSLGFIIGPALGGYLSVYGYSIPAYVAAGVSFLATILTFFFLPESRVPTDASLQDSKGRKVLFSVKDFYDALTHPNVGLLISLSFLIMLAFSIMQGTFALFTEHALGLTARNNGYIFAYIGLLGIVMQFFVLRRLLVAFRENVLVTFAVSCMAIAFVLFSVLSGIKLLLIGVTFLAFGNSICGPIIAGLLSKLTPDTEQGNIMGVNQSVNSIAQLIGPLLGTFIYSELGATFPYITSAGILIVAVMVTVLRLRTNLSNNSASYTSQINH